MKKTFKILGIIALAAAIGFSMMACPTEGTSRPAPPEKFITVTTIPSTYNQKIGAVKLYPIDDPSNPTVYSGVTVYSTEEEIKGNSVELPLYNWGSEDPWHGSGSYRIALFIFNDKKAAAAGQPIYEGFITEQSITETKTIIEWTSFTQKP
jgi:hypothetical protein